MVGTRNFLTARRVHAELSFSLFSDLTPPCCGWQPSICVARPRAVWCVVWGGRGGGKGGCGMGRRGADREDAHEKRAVRGERLRFRLV